LLDFWGVFAWGFWQIFGTILVYFIDHLVSFTDMVGQSIAKMLLKALYRLKFRLSCLISINIPTAKKVAKNVLFC
jgi:hypothetical protein